MASVASGRDTRVLVGIAMIRIGGAGVAGLACAANLSKSEDVTVYEKAHKVGSRYRQSVLAFRNYGMTRDYVEELRQVGVTGLKIRKITRIRKYSPSLKCAEVHSDNPLFYSVFRGANSHSIDSSLHQTCIKNGVKFVTGSEVSESDVDVVAIGGRETNVLGYGTTYENACVEQDTIHLFYDNRYAPKGYIYAVPFNSVLTVGLVCFDKDQFLNVPRMFDNLMENNPVLSGMVEGADRAHYFQNFAHYEIPKTAYRNGKHYVGEAAGFLEPSKGFGLRYALLSGHLAAKSILEKKDYDLLWKAAFGSELEEGMRMRRRFQMMTNDDYEHLIDSFGNAIEIGEYVKRKDNAFR